MYGIRTIGYFWKKMCKYKFVFFFNDESYEEVSVPEKDFDWE